MNLLFDYDGTIHDCIHIYAPAFRTAYKRLVQLGYAPAHSFTDGEISTWLGYNPNEMWATFQPDIPQEVKEECEALIGTEMLRLLAEGGARLYPGAEAVLQTLKDAGHTMLLLSNCQSSYMRAHEQFFALHRFFTACYAAEDFSYHPKVEIFAEIRPNYPGDFIVIGDRAHDLEIAHRYGLTAVGAAYGYGAPCELTGAAAVLSDIADLPALLLRLTR
ncbi:MAG: HAD family hydrolase [Oscillospiraceae bacterium]|nr:HAD family hydrolase [Oscillospiraceae bacterium]